jgi:hypothetical protein
MSKKYTRADREAIANDYVKRHGGYNPEGFVEEVAASKGKHPAWDWFTWDDAEASREYRIWQARKFVTNLRVSFKVETIRRGKMVLRYEEAPMLISPVENRRFGGGYHMMDTDDPMQMAEYCDEAVRALQTWLRRYSGAVAYAGGSTAGIEKQVAILQKAAAMDADAA